MGILDQQTSIYDGIIETVHLDKDSNLSIEYRTTIDGKKYSLYAPIKEDWAKYDDVMRLVRKMAKGYFDMLKAL